ncbi:MAG: hypothetical protein IJ821_02365 [Lachnospiraceae bacterium]|nr:hypothetical protein [Lachnospiraceae bacterium]
MSKNRKLITLFATMMMAVCMCVPAFAADSDSAGNVFEAGDSVSLPETPFFGGFIAGQSVEAEDIDAEGSVIMAGQSVNVNDADVGESLYIAGNIISVNDAYVNGNVCVAGNNIVLKSTEGNGVYIAGNQISFDGVANALHAAGNTVAVKGTIDGDAVIEADVVELDDDLKVTGSLTIRSVNEPKIPDNAPIKDFIYEPISSGEQQGGIGTLGIGIGTRIIKKLTSCFYWIVAMAAFGMLLCWLCGDHLTKASELVRTKPGAVIGCGIISWICIPVIAVALCCTYILAPVGGMLALLYVLLLCAGLAFAGASLVRIFLPDMNVFLSALIGIAALEIVRMIPVIGTLVGIAADMYLLAYVVLTLWDNRLKKIKQ